MSGGGGTQTVTQKTEIPEYIHEAAQRNLAAAYDVSANMMGPYTGQRVAGMTPGQMDIIGALTNNYAMSQPAYAYAQQMAANPLQVQAGQLSQTSLDPYMNPYTQSVVNTSLDALNAQRQTGLNQAADAAARAKSFGGSRQAIQEAAVNSAAQQQAGSLTANLMNQNFLQAQAAAQGDIGRQMMAQQLNQAAGLQSAGLLGNLAGAAQNSFLTGATGALAAQGLAQQQQQSELDAAMAAYKELQQFPIQQLQIPLQALGITPYGQSSTQTGPGPSGNGLMTGLGAAASIASIIGSL
jgi:hypothetical protein